MRTEWLHVDPLLKKYSKAHVDDHTGDVVIENQYDVEDIIDLNRRQFAAVDERARWKGDLHRVAEIPNSVYLELWQAGIVQDQRAFRRWLNDPDNRAFRVRPGRV